MKKAKFRMIIQRTMKTRNVNIKILAPKKRERERKNLKNLRKNINQKKNTRKRETDPRPVLKIVTLIDVVPLGYEIVFNMFYF
jgi:hypothetical protein